MSEFQQYVNYHTANDRIRERVEQTQRRGLAGQYRRHAGRRALARSLHSIADRLDA
jgi:hypothetical protein